MGKEEDELLKHMIETINGEGEDLSDWEISFMESITDQWDRKGYLSDKQKEIVERIYQYKVK